MANIVATTEWTRRPEETFTDQRYSREHRWRFDGGVHVVASSSPAVVPVPFSNEQAVDPEEAFLASVSSCHMLWFLALAAKRGLVIDRYEDQAVAEMEKNEAGKTFISKVRLRPNIQWQGESPSTETIDELHHLAHEECFIANSVRSEVTVQGQS